MSYQNSQQRNVRLNGSFPGVQRQAITIATPNLITAVTTADNTYNTVAAVAAIAELTTTIEVNKGYEVTVIVPLSIAAAAQGIQFDFGGGTATVTAMTVRAEFGITAVAPITAGSTTLTGALSGGVTQAWTLAKVVGYFKCTQEGTLQFRAAQAVSGATNSVVQAGTTLKLVEVKDFTL